MQLILIFFAGGFGALCRYAVGRGISAYAGTTSFPLATFSVNVLGSFAMGYLSWYLVHRLSVSKDIQVAILAGLLGGFTTFSAFSLELVRYIETGAYLDAVIYILFSVVICVAMCALGLYIARS